MCTKLLVRAVLVLLMGIVLGISVFASVPNEKTLVWGVYWEPSGIDPHATLDTASMWMCDNLYDTLVEYGTERTNDGRLVGTTKIVPLLAKSYSISDDGLTYTFYLNEGVTFQDGSVLDAEAVRYSLNRMLTMNLGPATVISEYMNTSSTVVVDECTIEIHLTTVCPFFLNLIADSRVGAIVNPAIVEAHGGIEAARINEWMRNNSAGSGPFKWGEKVPGTSWELVANQSYWRGKPALNRVVFKVINDFSVQYLMLQSGELDIIYRLPPDMTQDAFNLPGIVVNKDSLLGLQYLWINNTIPPFDNPLVRKALIYAIDQQEINEAAAMGLSTPAKSWIPAHVEGYTDEFWVYDHNVEKARELLTEAGYADGFTTQFFYNSGNSEREQTGIILQQQLARVGINLELNAIAWPTFTSYQDEGKMPLFAIAKDGALIVDSFLIELYHSKNKGGAGNYNFYENPELDTLLESLIVTVDSDVRIELLYRIQEILAADLPSVPIYAQIMYYIQRDWVHDWALYPAGNWEFYSVYKEAAEE